MAPSRAYHDRKRLTVEDVEEIFYSDLVDIDQPEDRKREIAKHWAKCLEPYLDRDDIGMLLSDYSYEMLMTWG